MTKELVLEHLARVARLLQADEREADGLLPVQVEVLRYLDRCNRFSDQPAAVADYLGVTKGTASQTINVLVAAGLVDKRVDAVDRRVVHLAITTTGHERLKRIRADSTFEAALAELGPAGQRSLDAGLERLMRAIQAAGDVRSFGVCESCRHFEPRGGEPYRCGLLVEPLSTSDATRICREHEERARVGP